MKSAKAIAKLRLDSLRWNSGSPKGFPIKVRSVKIDNFSSLDRLDILKNAEIAELSLFFSSATSLAPTAAILRQVSG